MFSLAAYLDGTKNPKILSVLSTLLQSHVIFIFSVAGYTKAVWLPYPGVWVTKGSSFPITLNGPDK